MKKLIALVLLLLCVLGVVGCMSKTYELPHDQFCYSVDGAQAYELDSADKQYCINMQFLCRQLSTNFHIMQE